jgi:aspartyl-tRNA(Asn)/glutamyl-tRNA(Gln) amidotransferase subunit B
MPRIVYEVNRQRALLSKEDGVVPQETRGFNQDTLETFKMRSKEEAPDYRYMPDPNLGFLLIASVILFFQLVSST